MKSYISKLREMFNYGNHYDTSKVDSIYSLDRRRNMSNKNFYGIR